MALSQEGHTVSLASEGRQAYEMAIAEKHDLILLEFFLQDLDGKELCQMIRHQPVIHGMGILVVFEKKMDGLAAACLNSGADAYIENPKDVHELVAYSRALLRRPKVYFEYPRVIQKGQITVRVTERRVLFEDRSIDHLTPKEFELIKQVILHAPEAVTKERLSETVWGLPFSQLNRQTLDVHIQRLRRKLGPKACDFLKTVATIGYRWDEHIPEPAKS